MGGSQSSGVNAVPDADSPWEDARSPKNDRYKGLTPPISPAQVRGRASLGLAAHWVQFWSTKVVLCTVKTAGLSETRGVTSQNE